MARTSPRNGMKSSAKGRAKRICTLRGWVCLFLAAAAVLAVTASARQQQQSATQGGAAGSRQSGVGPKRQTQRRGAGASKAEAAAGAGAAKVKTSIRSALQGVEEALAAGQPVLATADFDLIGLAVTAGPATQTVPKNTPTSVLTSMLAPEGSDPSAAAAGLNPNYRVRGELSGPSLGSPVTVEAAVGQPLRLPPLSTAGDHVLQNLRVVDIGVEGQPTVAPVTPDACGVVVIERLLVSEVQVRELTYEQIVQAGINISDDSYRFFNFTLGVSTTSSPQQVSIPVAFPGVGAADPRPVVGAPLPVAPGVTPPQLVPDILPVMLEVEGGRDGLDLPPDVPLRIPGVVVFPGRIGLLHQFFEATVIVANGAPAGAPLVVHSLKAKVRLPDAGTPADPADDPLRIAETRDAGRVTELELHDLGADGKYGTADDVKRFAPGKSGQGSFLVEGLKEGLHTINFDLEGTLEGLPAGPVTVRGEVPGAVLVRDASFGVTFSHPSVVRAGQEYDLALTLYNSGQRDIQSAVADLTRAGVSGAELLGDEVRRQFPPVARGESATVRWRLRANVTGAVTASYAKVGTDISAGLSLVTGVGDRNVPLSPDSLILPDTVNNLPPTVAEAARAVLGQAWSIATAPEGGLPEGVVKVDKRTVVNRAVQLGIAGLRAGFGEPASVSHATLMRDWLGELEAEPDPGFADVLRDTAAGFDFYDSVGAEAARSMAEGRTAADLLGEFVASESPRSPFIFALVTQARGARVAGARLIDGAGRAVGFGGEPVVRSGDLRSGASLRLLAAAPGGTGGEELGQMLLASRPSNETWSLELTGEADGVVNVALALPVSGVTYRHLVVEGVQVARGARYRLTFGTSGTGAVALEEFRGGAFVQTGTAASTSATLSEPAPRVVGVMQVTPEVLAGGDKYGRLVGLLFSKPMAKAAAETASNYTIGGGALASNPAEQVGGLVRARGAKLDYGDRFAFLSLDTPVGPFVERTLGVSGLTDRRGAGLSPLPSNLPIPMRVSPQGVPPGAYLTGRVLGADGSPVAGAQVVYWTKECDQQGLLPPEPKPLAERLTDADGRYAFDYVRNGDCGPLLVTVTNPTTRSEKRLTTPVAYHGQHMTLDMVFLARGGVRGTISMGGRPLPNAVVQVIPSLDAMGSQVVQADGFGQYAAEDVPVGNVSVLAVGTGVAANASGVAAGTIEGPGRTATVNVSLQNVSGVVRGRVVNPDTGASPAAGALVVAYARIPGFGNEQRGDGLTPVGWVNASRDGNFAFENLPVGDITLEVTDYVTGLAARRQVQLTAGTPEVGGVVITLPGFGTVSGQVVDETGGFVPNAVVQGAGRAVQADAIGTYTLPNMPAGTHRITATDPATFMSGSVDVEVRLGQNASGINIPVLRPATITGRVFLQEPGAAAVPAAGVFVTANGYTRVQTDAAGRYTVKNVKPNTNVTLRFVELGQNYVINMPVVVTPGEVLTRDATFRPGSIHGRVTQPDGVSGSASPLSVFSPLPVLTEGEHWGKVTTERPRTTQSGGDGAYRMDGVNPGTFRVTTSSPFFPTPVSAGGVLPPNGDAEVNFSLVNTLAGKIQGTVYKPGGTTPAGPGMKVTLGGGALADVSVTTDAAGRYEFAEVFAGGGYWLTATDPATGETNRVRISVQKNKDVLADITLRGRGALRVAVVDGAGNPVQHGQLSLAGGEYPNAQRYIDLTPAMNGVFEFGNLPEGPYAVSATQSGLAGRASADVATGATVEVAVQLQASGTVRGRAFMPDGVTPIGLADVELRLGGRQVGFSVTSDAEEDRGAFSFLNVPVGDFQLDVFDNRTGRVGRATGRLDAQGQVAEVSVKLLPVGAVAGRVTANGQPVDHALVEIFANGSGIRAERMKATTDAEGRYRFTGVPVGSFQINVTGAPGGQTGSASGFVTGAVEPLADTVVDIALEPSVTVAGAVRSLSGETVNGARVTVLVGNRRYETGTNEQGVYRIGYIPLGEVRVRAEAPAGYNRGEAAPVTAAEPGATLTSDVTLAGTGSVSGTAFNNDGSPLSTGTVTYTNDAWSGTRITVAAPVQANGRYEIRGAPAGPFALQLTVANRVGVGSASGELSADQTLDLPVRLEDAGQVVGRLKAVDGVSPAAGADVTLNLVTPSGKSLRFYAHTDAAGIWRVANVPLGGVTASAFDSLAGGVARYGSAQLASNNQTLDLGEASLDNTPVRVESVSPQNGATGVSPAAPTISVSFSEPVDAATINASTVRLVRDTSNVQATPGLSGDGRTLTISPSGKLADTTQYAVVVTTGVADLAGNHLASEVRSAFTTSDGTPPAVTGFTPANGATRVALSADVVVTFNEKLDPAQDFSQVVVITADGAPPAAVPGTLTPSADGLSVTFHPTNLLGEGLRHTVSVQGQRDVYGNATAAAVSSVFTTLDLMPPVIEPLPIDGKTVRTFRPQITAAYGDSASGVNVASVVLKLDGVNVTPQASVADTGLSYTPAAPLARGPHTVTLNLSDNQGNAAQQATAAFSIDDAGPAISSFTIAGLPASNDMYVTSTLQPSFVVGYADDTGVNASLTKLLFGPYGSTLQPVASTVTQNSLSYTPAAPLAEGRYSVEATIVNSLGTSSTTGRIDFTLDVDAPDILSATPTSGGQHGGTVVTINGNRLLNTTGTAPAVTVGGNPALVKSAVAGSPDRVVFVTPAGVPGPADIRVSTNRGEGVRPAAFNYEADPRTPFLSEPDTVLLWHLDELANGAVRVEDSSPTRALAGTASGSSLAAPGRFAGGRSSAHVQTQTVVGALYFGSSSFTVEGWFKSGPVGRTYTLFGKEDFYGYYYGPPEYAVRLTPSGNLRALAFDGSSRQWFVDVPASTYKVDDNLWHYVVMVVDRTNTRLSLYVDGIERAYSSTPPAGFGALYNSGQPFRVGHWAYYEPQTTGGPEEFPGTLDEVRVSSTAHTAALIQKTYLGTEGTLGVSITNSGPANVPVGTSVEIQLEGYNLSGATPSVTGPAAARLSARVLSSSATRSRVLVTAESDAAPGDAQLVMSSVQGSATLALRVIDLSRISLAAEPDTKLLWHLDETGNGAVGIIDAGRLHINGTSDAASLAQPGRFAGARASTNIATANGVADLYFGTSNFTVEGWFKSGPVGRTYTLFGKEDFYGYYYGPPEYAVRLTPSGNLRALAFDGSSRQWFVDMPASTYKVDDNLWHYVVMVVDRTNTRLSLYVDGIERAYSTTPPAGFGALYNSGQPFRVGHWAYYEPQTTGGPEAFPGTIDEVRVSSTAHSVERILNDLIGSSPMRVTSYSPRELLREKDGMPPYTNQFTVEGYNLDGVTARLQVNGQDAAAVVNVTSSSYRQAVVTVNAAPTAPLGNGQIVISKQGQTDVALDVRVGDQAQSTAFSDTVLLWNLNETGNGAVRILDSGALGIHGTAGGLSQAQPGHFGGGRSRPLIVADGDNNALKFGTSSFTAECWFKSGVVGRTYTLVGKEDFYGYYYGPPEFAIKLLPSGGLRAVAYDANQRKWAAEMPASAYEVNDNQWHHAAMVVDRANNKLSLYIDGVVRASAAPPSGFGALYNSGQQLRAGKWSYYDEGSSGGEEFPGVLDDIRISASAHTAEQILSNMNGVPGLRVNSYSPQEAPRNKATGETYSTLVTLAGFGLDGVNASLTRNGQPLDATATVESSTFNQAQVRLSFNSGVATGTAQLVLTKSGLPAASVDVRVYEQSELATDTDTRLLWHLNETGNGAVRVLDSGALGIHGTAGGLSQAQPGHFGGGRSRPLIVADGDYGALYFGSSSYTAECWFKTGTVGRTYTLVGKEDFYGYYYGPPEFAIKLLPSGGLRAVAYDANQRKWAAETVGRTYDPTTGRWLMTLDDNQWHHASMVVDRANNRMTLYVDGVERASSAPPSGFGALYNSGQPLRVGKWSYYDEGGSGGEEFPGVIDEVRVSASAHTPDRVLADALGTDTARVALTQPTIVQRGSANLPLTFTGNGLSNATVTTAQPEVTVAVVSSSATQLNCLLTVPSGVPVGALSFAVAVTGGQVFNPSLTVVDQQPFVNDAGGSESLVLWHMDETGNGAVRVGGSGDAVPNVVGGNATGLSQAQTGRFGGGRVKANIVADNSAGLYLGTNSFTVECWVKPGTIGRTYTLVGKEDTYGYYYGPPEYALKLLPSGGLRAVAYDANQRKWAAEMPGRLYDATTGNWQITVNDGQWHYVSMVVDRANNRMTLYVDGVERASSAPPTGFGALYNSGQPLRVGKWSYYDEGGSGGEEFPGALDEVRVLDFARTAAQVRDTWLGTNTANSVANKSTLALEAKAAEQPAGAPQPALGVDAVAPGEVVRDKGAKEARTTNITLKGSKLDGITARVMRDGRPLGAVVAGVLNSSDAEATLSLAVSPKVPLGPAQLLLSKPGHKDTEVEVHVIEPSEFAAEADTVGLWHLDEREEGAARLLDAGARGFNLNSAPASRAAVGRFGGGRALARAASAAGGEALSFGASGFTLEGWVKTGALGRDYVLFGKEGDNGQNTEYTLKLTASGALRAEVYDTNGALWQAETSADSPKLTDDAWHSVALVLDREANLLLLYVDGRGRAVAPAPPDFKEVRNLGQPLVFGCYDADSAADGGPEEFPGRIDEVRVSSTAHRAEKITADYLGHDAPEVTLVRTAAAQQAGAVNVTLHGYGLGGVAVTASQPDVKVSIKSASRTRVELLLSVSESRAAYGLVRLTLEDALGQTADADVDLAQVVNLRSPNTQAKSKPTQPAGGGGLRRAERAGDAFGFRGTRRHDR